MATGNFKLLAGANHDVLDTLDELESGRLCMDPTSRGWVFRTHVTWVGLLAFPGMGHVLWRGWGDARVCVCGSSPVKAIKIKSVTIL